MSAGGYHDFMLDNNVTIYNDLAEKLACSGDRFGGDSNAVLECMRKVDAQAMIKMYDKIRNYDPLDPGKIVTI
uniref:Uncharacterized protein n=1 Tax=Romanomermis culicivorax TaxID=13658 RepID=A0A915HIB0_ROMCU